MWRSNVDNVLGATTHVRESQVEKGQNIHGGGRAMNFGYGIEKVFTAES
jgi:hypothetical protein